MKDAAKAVHPRFVHGAGSDASTSGTAPPVAATSLSNAHAGVGNAVIARQQTSALSARQPAESLKQHSQIGNAAIQHTLHTAPEGKSPTPQPYSASVPEGPEYKSLAKTPQSLNLFQQYPRANQAPLESPPSPSSAPPDGEMVGTEDFAAPAQTDDHSEAVKPVEPKSEETESETMVFAEELIVAGRPVAEEAEEEKKEEAKQEEAEAESVEAESEKAEEEKLTEAEASAEEAKEAEQEKPEEAKAAGEEAAKAKPDEIVNEAEAAAEAGPSEAEVGAAEAASSEETVAGDQRAAGEAAGEVAAPAEKGGGGGPAPGLSAWKAKVTGATQAIKQPDMKDPAGAGGRVRTAGGAASSKAAAAREGVGKQAEAVVPPPPKPPDPLPTPAEDPLPAASKLVRDASEKKLPNQTLPKIETTPAGTVPKVGKDLSGAYSTKVSTESEIAAAAQAEKEGKEGEAGGKNPDKEKQKKIKDAAAKKADAEGKEGPGEPMVLVDEGPPPPPAMTKTTQTDVGKVLAVLLADPDAAAKEIVRDARRAAYPKGMLLEKNYDDFGDAVQPDILTQLTEQLDKVREQAGVSKEELDRHVLDRKNKTTTEATTATEDVGAAGEDEKTKLEEEGQKTADAIAGAREAVAVKTEQTVEAASGETDPVVIKSKRERLVRGVTRKAIQQSIIYVKAGERREKSLDDMNRAIQTGYTLAAREDETKVFEELKKAGKSEEDARAEAKTTAAPSFTWLQTKLKELGTAFGTLKKEAKDTATTYDTNIKTAGAQATEMYRSWAAELLDKHQTFWQWLMDLFSDWSAQADEAAAVWEEERTAEARDGIVRDLEAMEMVKTLEARKIDGKLAMGMAGLTDEQRAVIKAYYEGPTKGDSIAAVAVGLRTRLSAQRRPALISRFESMLMDLPKERWKDIDLIAQAQSPGQNAYKVASEVHGAVDQWGTDEARIYAALANLTPLRANAARKCYSAHNWGDMDADIKSELGGAELDRAQAQLSGDQALADAATLREAMKGGLTGLGTDEQTIMQVLRGKSEEERKAIIEAYKREYGEDLKADLKDEMSSHDLDRADALMAGDVAKADAIAIDQAMHGGLFGLGTEEKDIENVYAQNRQEVEAEAAAKGWNTAQIEAEIKRRNQKIEGKYNEKYDIGPEGMSLREAFKDELSGPELDLAVALQDNDATAADMARLEIEKQSVVYASDEAINNVLKAQGDRARKEVERDERLAMQQDAEIDALRGFPWDKTKWDSERAKLEKRIETKTEEKAKANMSALEKGYDQKYSKFGSGGLRYMLAMNTSGSDQDMAFDLFKQNGLLRPEQEIDYAIQGAGTDEDTVKRVLTGKSPAQIKKIRDAWEAKHPGQSFDAEVLSEFSGRERFDMEIMLDGEPQTPKEKLAQAKKKLTYEQTAYGWGGAFSEEERAHMEAEAEDLERDVKRLESLDPESEEYQRAYERYNLQSAYMDQSVDNHRAAVDSATDTLATIAGIVATILVIVAAVAVTVLTGGAAAPGILAALGTVMTNAGVAAAAAGAAALATVGTKQLMKGSAYGVEEMGIDLAVGAADAVASGLTAGLGGKLLKMGRLAAMSKSGKMLPRLFANAMAEGAEGFASSLPSALTGSMLDDRNWKGDPFSNIMGSAMVGVGMGTVLSGGMGMLGGISKPAKAAAGELSEGAEVLAEQAAKHPPPLETPEMLAKRGTPTERIAGFESFQKANPGKSYDDFIKELDAGVLTHKADDTAVQQVNKRLRDELFSAIPAGQRDQFNDVVIDVVTDAEFTRLTRSTKGQAVVLIENGKPRVLMRESADVKALKEEGIHLLQSVDPKKAHLFKELDESVLANWDQLPLDQQLSLYSKKLDLEIDGQQRLIQHLDEALEAAGDDAAMRRQILDQLDEAKESLDNLSRRLDEVAEITPQKRLDIADGKVARPDYLDQPARLFQKKTKKVKLAAITKSQKDLLEAIEQQAKSPAAAKKAVDAAETALEELRKKAGSSKAMQKVYRTVAETANQLGPIEGPKYLKKVKALVDSRKGHLDRVAGFLTASQKASDPGDFLNKVVKLSDQGGKGSRLLNQTMGDIAGKVSQLTPLKASAYLDELTDLLDNLPSRTKVSEMSHMLSASAKSGDPSKFLAKLRSVTDHIKANNLPIDDGVLAHMGERAAKLNTKQANAYLDAFNKLVRNPDVDVQRVNGFLRASKNSRNPGKYLDLVGELSARKALGLSDDAIEALAKKADDKALDLEWLMETPLLSTKNKAAATESMEILDFLAKDDKTPWTTLKEAFDNPDNEWLIRWSRARLRGIAAEIVTSTKGISILHSKGITSAKMTGRQVKMYSKSMVGELSEIDFEVTITMGNKVHGFEVKGYTKQTWEKAIDGWILKHSKKAVPKELKDALKKIDGMLTQLQNAFEHTGNPAFLALTDKINSLSPARKKKLQFILSMVPGGPPELVHLTESEITAMSAKLRKRFGLE